MQTVLRLINNMINKWHCSVMDLSVSKQVFQEGYFVINLVMTRKSFTMAVASSLLSG